ncbi:MAG: thioredoxin domain-containing protein [Leifsonia sp.]
MITDINSDTFNEDVLRADQTVIVYFWASWCQPCKAKAPVFEELSETISNLKFVKVRVDDPLYGEANMKLAGDYGIKTIPRIMSFGKEEVAILDDEITKTSLLKFLS